MSGDYEAPKLTLNKEPDIIKNVSGSELPTYVEASLKQNIVQNLGWALSDLRGLEDNSSEGFSEWNSKRIQSCLAKLHTSMVQVILVQQGHMYSDIKKKIATAKKKMAEIDAKIDDLDHESFMDAMAIFAEQLAGIAGIAFAFASAPLMPAVIPVVAAFATTGFTLRDVVKTVNQKNQYKQERTRIALEIQKLEKELEKDIWHDYIYGPETK